MTSTESSPKRVLSSHDIPIFGRTSPSPLEDCPTRGTQCASSYIELLSLDLMGMKSTQSKQKEYAREREVMENEIYN